MLTELGERMGEYSESFNKELENIKKTIRNEEFNSWKEKKTTHTLEEMNSSLSDSEKLICDLNDRKWKSPNWQEEKKPV